MKFKSILFKTAFCSGLVMVVLGAIISTLSFIQMKSIAKAQHQESIQVAEQFLLKAAQEQSSAITSRIDAPMDMARTLAEVLKSGIGNNESTITDTELAMQAHKYNWLKSIVESAAYQIKEYAQKVTDGKMTQEEARQHALDTIRNIRFDDGKGYLWIVDQSEPYPDIVMHPIKPELEGTKADNPSYNCAIGKDRNGQNFFKALQEQCKEQGEGYICYKWPEPGQTEPTKKLSYGKVVPEYGWIIGSGINIHSLTAMNRQDVNNMLRQVVLDNPDIVGICTCWEPNAFDGLDQQYANTTGHDATGRFIPYWCHDSSGQVALEPLMGYEQEGDGDYYLLPKKHLREQIINPYVYPVQGHDVLMTTVSAPIVADNQFYGITTVDLDLAVFQTIVDQTSSELYRGMASVDVIAYDGTIVAASNMPELSGKPMSSKHEDWEENLKTIQTGQPLVEEDEGNLLAIVPFTIGQTNTPWAVFLSVPMEEITLMADASVKQANQAITRLIGISIIGTIVGIIVMISVAGVITRPIKRATVMLKDIAEGEGDLTRRLEVKSQDEVGEMARWFNIFVDKIQNLIRDVAGSANRLGAASNDLLTISEQTSTGARESSERSNTVAAASEQMSANTTSVAAGMEQATASLASVASATEEMTSTISEIASNTEKASSTTGQAAQKADAFASLMRELGNAAQEIGKVTESIMDISDQTNLLALNATIEAARAGEAGKGFAVVANEIKTLAQQTNSATDDIQKRIEAIQTASENAVSDIESIVQVIQDVNSIVTTIASAIEEQSAVTREVAGNITQASNGVQDAASRASQMASASQEISREIISVSTTAGQMNKASTQLQTSAQDLSTIAEQIGSLMGRFKV